MLGPHAYHAGYAFMEKQTFDFLQVKNNGRINWKRDRIYVMQYTSTTNSYSYMGSPKIFLGLRPQKRGVIHSFK
jgi:hypothetical protein